MKFLWGVASSAYQLEGGPGSDWAAWKSAPPSGHPFTGHRRFWREDFERLSSLGANAYRFSVEWSRIEPAPGEFSAEELALQRERLERLHLLGIEPVVTFFHYTHPRWFWRFGWESREGRRSFVNFVTRCADAFGDLARLYTILNEPVPFVLGGYVDGSIPPGQRDFSAAGRALEGLCIAQIDAAEALRARVPGARLGIAHNLMEFAPARDDSLADRRLAAAADRFYNVALLEALSTGDLDFSMPFFGRFRGRLPDLPHTCDFIGVNYYSRLHLRLPGAERWPADFLYRDVAGLGLTDNGWEIHPEGLVRCLARAAQTGRPLLVTENGIAARDDSRRRRYLRDHVVSMRDALARGLDVRGYFHWSLLDNFEWIGGFSPRFGLFEVDYATLERRRRASADLFRELGRPLLQRDFTSI